MKNNYIIIGDSIVYGIGDYKDNGWTSMLKNRIINMDNSINSNNYVHIIGFPGATSKDIALKTSSILDTFAFEGVCNKIILSVGINDTQTTSYLYDYELQKVSINEFQKNIENIINLSKKYSSNIIILGLTRIYSDTKYELKSGRYIENKTIEKYDLLLKNICNRYDVDYIEMADLLFNEDYIDTIHPNNSGHRKIYNRVKTKILYSSKK